MGKYVFQCDVVQKLFKDVAIKLDDCEKNQKDIAASAATVKGEKTTATGTLNVALNNSVEQIKTSVTTNKNKLDKVVTTTQEVERTCNEADDLAYELLTKASERLSFKTIVDFKEKGSETVGTLTDTLMGVTMTTNNPGPTVELSARERAKIIFDEACAKRAELGEEWFQAKMAEIAKLNAEIASELAAYDAKTGECISGNPDATKDDVDNKLSPFGTDVETQPNIDGKPATAPEPEPPVIEAHDVEKGPVITGNPGPSVEAPEPVIEAVPPQQITGTPAPAPVPEPEPAIAVEPPEQITGTPAPAPVPEMSEPELVIGEMSENPNEEILIDEPLSDNDTWSYSSNSFGSVMSGSSDSLVAGVIGVETAPTSSPTIDDSYYGNSPFANEDYFKAFSGQNLGPTITGFGVTVPDESERDNNDPYWQYIDNLGLTPTEFAERSLQNEYNIRAQNNSAFGINNPFFNNIATNYDNDYLAWLKDNNIPMPWERGY